MYIKSNESFISFSEQKSSTATIAADANDEPFRDKSGKLFFRPGGHGALIENLNDLDADVIFIKNIDNVVHDAYKSDTVDYKFYLAGLLVEIQDQVFEILRELDAPDAAKDAEITWELFEFQYQYLCPKTSDVTRT